MTQWQIIQLFKKYPRKHLTEREVAKLLNYTDAQDGLRKLYRNGILDRRPTHRPTNHSNHPVYEYSLRPIPYQRLEVYRPMVIPHHI